MKKFLYFLPAVVICLIYGFILLVLEGSFDAVIEMVYSVVLLYIALPVVGSFLLAKGRWWGSLFGIAMGLLLVVNNLQYTGHQHVNIDLPLGIAFAVYNGLMGVVCVMPERKGK